jgi:hypothetical protein
VFKRGASPTSINTFPSSYLRRWILKESQREAKPLLYNSLPLPLDKGKGDKEGMGLINNLAQSVDTCKALLGY